MGAYISNINIIEEEEEKKENTDSEIVKVVDMSSCGLNASLKIDMQPYLEILDLSRNKLNSVDISLESLKKLKVNSNKLESLVLNAPKLQVLELNDNQLNSIDFSSISGVKSLGLNACGFDKIPVLDGLVEFGISCNKISSLDGLCLMKHLVRLDLSYNAISVLPKEISSLTELVFLNLSRNKLTFLPKELKECEKLTDLGLADNKIRSFSSLPLSLQNVDCSNNNLVDIDCLMSLPFLSYLNARGNFIKEISCVSASLKFFDVSFNRLECLPSDVMNDRLKLLCHGNLFTQDYKYELPTLLELSLNKILLSDSNLDRLPRILKQKLLKTRKCQHCSRIYHKGIQQRKKEGELVISFDFCSKECIESAICMETIKLMLKGEKDLKEVANVLKKSRIRSKLKRWFIFLK